MDNKEKKNSWSRRCAVMTLLLVALAIGSTTTSGWAKDYQPDALDLQVQAAISFAWRDAGLVFVSPKVGWQVVAYREADKPRLQTFAPYIEYSANKSAYQFAKDGGLVYDSAGYVKVAGHYNLVLRKTAHHDSKGRQVHLVQVAWNHRASAFYESMARHNAVLAREIRTNTKNIAVLYKAAREDRVALNELLKAAGKQPLPDLPPWATTADDHETVGSAAQVAKPPTKKAPVKKAPKPSQPKATKKPVAKKPPVKKTAEPKVAINVTSGPTVDKQSVALSGTAANATAVRVMIGSHVKRATLSADGKWSIRFRNVEPGSHRLQAAAMNRRGKVGDLWQGTVKVEAPPSPTPSPKPTPVGGGTITSPKDGESLSKGSHTVSGTVGSADASTVRVYLGGKDLGGGPIQVMSTGQWEFEGSFPDSGSHTIRVVEFDRAAKEIKGAVTTGRVTVTEGGSK